LSDFYRNGFFPYHKNLLNKIELLLQMDLGLFGKKPTLFSLLKYITNFPAAIENN